MVTFIGQSRPSNIKQSVLGFRLIDKSESQVIILENELKGLRLQLGELSKKEAEIALQKLQISKRIKATQRKILKLNHLDDANESRIPQSKQAAADLVFLPDSRKRTRFDPPKLSDISCLWGLAQLGVDFEERSLPRQFDGARHASLTSINSECLSQPDDEMVSVDIESSAQVLSPSSAPSLMTQFATLLEQELHSTAATGVSPLKTMNKGPSLEVSPDINQASSSLRQIADDIANGLQCDISELVKQIPPLPDEIEHYQNHWQVQARELISINPSDGPILDSLVEGVTASFCDFQAPHELSAVESMLPMMNFIYGAALKLISFHRQLARECRIFQLISKSCGLVNVELCVFTCKMFTELLAVKICSFIARYRNTNCSMKSGIQSPYSPQPTTDYSFSLSQTAMKQQLNLTLAVPRSPYCTSTLKTCESKSPAVFDSSKLTKSEVAALNVESTPCLGNFKEPVGFDNRNGDVTLPDGREICDIIKLGTNYDTYANEPIDDEYFFLYDA